MNGQPQFQPPPATWSITGVVVRNPYLGENSIGAFAFVTLRVGANEYFDVACKSDGPLQQIGGLRSGDDVTIAGRLRRGKMKGVQDEQGRARYETKLNADWVQVRTRAQAPQQQQPAQHAAPQQQYFHQQQPYPQQTARTENRAPVAFAPPPDDDIPF